MRWALLVALGLLAPGAAQAQTYTVGGSGWQVERLSDRFVVLRTDIRKRSGQQERQGLLMLTCDPQARRIRFQIGTVPGQPSLEAEQSGRAAISGRSADGATISPFHASVRFFPDGSLEILEAVGFTDEAMRRFLMLLKEMPAAIDIDLYRGPETGAFVQSTPLRLKVEQLSDSLVGLYGFEGLCYQYVTRSRSHETASLSPTPPSSPTGPSRALSGDVAGSHVAEASPLRPDTLSGQEGGR